MSRTHPNVEAFLESLSSADKTLADWARERGLDLTTAYQVSSGRLKGRHGEARRVLRAMGVAPPARRTRIAQAEKQAA